MNSFSSFFNYNITDRHVVQISGWMLNLIENNKLGKIPRGMYYVMSYRTTLFDVLYSSMYSAQSWSVLVLLCQTSSAISGMCVFIIQQSSLTGLLDLTKTALITKSASPSLSQTLAQILLSCHWRLVGWLGRAWL